MIAVSVLVRKILQCICLVSTAGVLAGCASYYAGDRYEDRAGQPDGRRFGVIAPKYYGYGEGRDQTEAEKQAEADALFRAASVLLEDAALLYGERIERVIENIRNHDPYIIAGSRETVDWSREQGTYQIIAGIRINLDALADRMAQEGLKGGQVTDRNVNLRLTDEQVPQIGSRQHLRDVLSRPERIWEDIEKPVFLVYHNEGQNADPALASAAAAAANRSLSNYGMEYIAYNQVQEILADQDLVFTDVTGRESTLRWIASRFRNDYYINVSFQTSARQTAFSRYEGEAYITLTCYDSYTARGIAEVVHQTGPVTGAASSYGARIEALQQGMEKAMDELMHQIGGEIVAEARSGEQYELIIINSYSDRMMREFAQQLEYRVRSLRRSSFSLDESRYVLVYEGSVEELEDVIYEASSLTPGLSGMYLVYQRGNSLTFDSGM